MLNVALGFLAVELNSYLRAKYDTTGDKVNLSSIVDESGKYLIDDDSIGISIINIEEERVVKEQLKDSSYRGGRHIILPPKLKHNVYTIICSKL